MALALMVTFDLVAPRFEVESSVDEPITQREENRARDKSSDNSSAHLNTEIEPSRAVTRFRDQKHAANDDELARRDVSAAPVALSVAHRLKSIGAEQQEAPVLRGLPVGPGRIRTFDFRIMSPLL
jgi:hypothetical protein